MRQASILAWASSIDVNWWTFRHSSRSRPLNASMKAFSTGFPGPNEIELHTACVRPVLKRVRHELGAVIHGDGPRDGTVHQRAIERLADTAARHAGDGL